RRKRRVGEAAEGGAAEGDVVDVPAGPAATVVGSEAKAYFYRLARELGAEIERHVDVLRVAGRIAAPGPSSREHVGVGRSPRVAARFGGSAGFGSATLARARFARSPVAWGRQGGGIEGVGVARVCVRRDDLPCSVLDRDLEHAAVEGDGGAAGD